MTTITSTELCASGTYVNLGDDVNDASIAQTVLAYAKRTAAPEGGFGYFFGRTDTNSINGHRFFVLTAERLGFGGSSSGNPDKPYNNGAVVSSLNEWMHYGATWDGGLIDDDAIRYFTAGSDGTVVSDSTAYQGYNGSGSATSAVGKELFLLNRKGLGRAFVGSVAYVARWNRVLSLAEIQQARDSGPLSVPDGLTLCWANGQDYGPQAYAPVARSTPASGEIPPHTALGGTPGTTAPTLTSPSATATGATTASGSVTTDEANGTLYWLASGNASESVATVKAGSSQAVTATGAQNVTVSGLTASTSYYLHYVHADSAANDSAVATSAQITTSAAGDTTPPTLTGAVTFASVTQTSYTAQWPAGSDNVAVTGYEYQIGSTAGAWTNAGNNLSAAITGRTAGATETVYARTYDAAGYRSTPAISGEVTLVAAPIPVKGIAITLHNGAAPQSSVSGITALWWNATFPGGAPDFETATASTDAAGSLVLDLDAVTGLAIDGYGYLLLHKPGTLGAGYRDALAFAGAVQVSDIS